MMRLHGGATRRHRRAFTLLELLVVMSIIVLLLSLLVSALRPVRVKKELTRQLSMHHQLILAINLYASDERGYFPYFATVGDPYGPILVDGFNVAPTTPYFGALGAFWAAIVVPRYFDSQKAVEFENWHYTSRIRAWPTNVFATQFGMTHGAVSAPAYWDGDTPPENLSLLHGMRMEQTRYPSQKVLLLKSAHADKTLHYSLDVEGWRTTVGLVDGSARIVTWPDDLRPNNFVYRPFGARPWEGAATRHGLHGRDF